MTGAKPNKKTSNLRADAKAYEEELKKKISEKERDPNAGASHPDTAALLSRLGALYVSTSKWKEAVTILERALDIQEAALKADHPQIPLTLSYLLDVYMKLGKHSDIELKVNQYDRKAQQEVGPEHPLVGEIKYNLGSFYRVRSRYPESRESFETSLNIWHKKLRPDHPRLLSVYMELSGVCKILGMNEQAEALLKRTIKIRSKILGEDHSKVGEHWKDLGLFYKNINKLKEADAALQKALEILSKALGKQNPLLAYIRHTLTEIQDQMAAKAAEAEAAQKAAQPKNPDKPPGG